MLRGFSREYPIVTSFLFSFLAAATLFSCGRLGFDSRKTETVVGLTGEEERETCNDGNTLAGDGCDATGYIEVGWYCEGTPSECRTFCGDGIVSGEEECDDGANGDSCDGCLDNCQRHTNRCGDGIVCAPEECDDGANGDFCDGCLDDCREGPSSCTCGLSEEFVDTFDDNSMGSGWRTPTLTGGSLSEQGGQLVLTPSLNAIGGALVVNERYLDLRDSSVVVELVSTIDRTLNGYTRLTIMPFGDNNSFGFQQYSDSLECTVYGDRQYCTQPFDSLAHRWWRIRGTEQAIFWDTSADGSEWTNQATISHTFDLSHCRIGLAVWVLEETATPGEARFDNLNAIGGATGQGETFNCLACSQSDDFNDNAQGALWADSYTIGSATVEEREGQVVLTPPVNATGMAVYKTENDFDLRDNAVWISVPQTTSAVSGSATFFGVTTANGVVRLRKEGTTLSWEYETSGSVVTTIGKTTYDPIQHYSWRIRESNGILFFETAAENDSWFVQAGILTPIAVEQVQVFLSAETTAPLASPGKAHFDNYNHLD